jgi:hypothetical protein
MGDKSASVFDNQSEVIDAMETNTITSLLKMRITIYLYIRRIENILGIRISVFNHHSLTNC